MRGWICLFALAAVVSADAPDLQFAKKSTDCKPLQFNISVPKGWKIVQNRAAFAACGDGMGLRVTREPMLWDAHDFPDVWHRLLFASAKDAKVEARRVSGKTVFCASYPVPSHEIEICRIYAEENEMLYNVSFSLPKDATKDKKDKWVDTVLRSFECTAPHDRPELAKAATSVGRFQFHLPKGYEAPPKTPWSGALGKGPGADATFTKVLKGYEQPHVAGRIEFFMYQADVTYQFPDMSTIVGTDTKALAQVAWPVVKQQWSSVKRDPRPRGIQYGHNRGDGITAEGTDKEGIPKLYYAYAAKFHGMTAVLTLEVDEREVRLYRRLFRELCESLSMRGR